MTATEPLVRLIMKQELTFDHADPSTSIHAQLKAAKSVVSNNKKAESTFRQAAQSKNSAFTSILQHQSAKGTSSWLTSHYPTNRQSGVCDEQEGVPGCSLPEI